MHSLKSVWLKFRAQTHQMDIAYFGEKGGWLLINLFDFCRNMNACNEDGSLWLKRRPAHVPSNPVIVSTASAPDKVCDITCIHQRCNVSSVRRVNCIQSYRRAFDLGFIPLGNRIWHKKNRIAMETSFGKKAKSLYFMAEMYLLVFESKNCSGSIEKCLHL